MCEVMRGLCPKGQLFVTKWAQNWVYEGGLVQKVHFLGFCTPSQIKSGYGPGKVSLVFYVSFYIVNKYTNQLAFALTFSLNLQSISE